MHALTHVRLNYIRSLAEMRYPHDAEARGQLMEKERLYRVTSEQREQIIARITEYLGHHTEILGAWLYGSFHEGRPFHDIDIALYLRPDSPHAQNPIPIILALGDELERQVCFPIDLCVLNSAPLSFQFRATASPPLFMQDEEACYRLVEHIRRMYWDFEPMIRKQLREALT